MRLFFDMQYYQGFKVDGTSLYHTIIDILKALPKDYFCYVMLPDKTANPKWEYNVEKDFKGVKCGLKILTAEPYGSNSMRVGGRTYMSYSKSELEHIKLNKKPWYYDVIVTARHCVPIIKTYADSSQKDMWKCGVLYFSIDATVESKSNVNYYDELQAKLEVTNMLMADATIFHCEEDKKDICFGTAQKWLAPSVRMKLMKEEVLGVPIDFTYIKENRALFDKRRKDRKIPKLGYFNSFGIGKRPNEYAKIAETLYRLKGVKTVITSMEKVLFDKFDNQEFVDSYYLSQGREDYKKHLGDVDIVLAISTNETTGRSYFESIVAGNVVIFKNESWTKNIIPEWYPYKFDTLDQIEKMALWIADNIDEARENAKRLEAYVLEKYDNHACTERFIKALEKAKISNYVSDNDGNYKIFKQAIASEGLNRFTLDQLAKATASFTKNGKPLFPSQFLTRQRACEILKHFGYEDTYESEVPVFIKR